MGGTTTSIGALLASIKTTVESGTGTAGTTVGALTDAAADTTDTASVVALLRQIAEAINNGTGTSIGTNKSLSDVAGTNGVTVVDSAVSVLGAIGADNANNAFASTSVVANADGSVLERLEYAQSILDARALPRVARKIYTFNATAVNAYNIFTVTGAVKVKLYAVCTTGLTPAVAGATVSLGVVGTVAQFIAATLAADFLAGELWYDASPTTVIDLDSAVGAGSMAKTVIGNGADILIDVAVQAITSGVIEFMVEWEPISTDGNIVAA